MKSLHRVLLFAILASTTLFGQTNPLPLVNQPLVPDSIAPGSGEFMLTVNGTGFASDAVLDWNGSTRITIVSSSSSLQAIINAADLAKIGTASITVVNPAPGGGSSNVVYFPVRRPATAIAFAESAAFAIGSVAVADFNNDGIPDVAVAAYDDTTGAENILVYLGHGDGTFSAPLSTSINSYPSNIFVGDVNGDGKLDLLAASDGGEGDGNTNFYFGNGDGTFTQQPFGLFGAVECVGDWNGDGKLDLVAAEYDEDLSLSMVYLGDGTGNFTVSQSQIGYYNDNVLGNCVAGDFNGDGKVDLAFPGMGVTLGNGDGTFQTPIYYPVPYYGSAVVTADVNGDGKLDLISNGLSVLLGNGDGTFTSAGGVNLGQQPQGINIGDFNGDGVLDVVTWSNGSNNTDQTLMLLLGNGNGTFGAPLSFPIAKSSGSGYPDLGMADFNGDGKLDLVIPGSASTAILLQNTVALTPNSLAFGNQSTGTSSAPQTLTLSNIGTSTLRVGTISITGDRGFSETDNCSGGVAAGSSCSIAVVFSPVTGGAKTASIKVSYQGLGTPASATLTGTGVNAATVSLTPASLTFSTELVGVVSQPQTVTLTNTGTLAVTVSSIATTGAFTQTNNCPSSLTEGQNCQIQVEFEASARGVQPGKLSVTDTANHSPQNVQLSGTGTVVKLSATGVNFGDQKVGTTSTAVPITLNNEGTVPLAITQISITGTDATDFSQTNNCGLGIPAGASCTIALAFAPTTTGVLSATVSITDNGGASPQTVALTGTGD
jgi:VCBS repeat protein/centrosomal CEP192-like protein/HYDIN/CFA65/VesB family protein